MAQTKEGAYLLAEQGVMACLLSLSRSLLLPPVHGKAPVCKGIPSPVRVALYFSRALSKAPLDECSLPKGGETGENMRPNGEQYIFGDFSKGGRLGLR